jgi:hypothetical protein
MRQIDMMFGAGPALVTFASVGSASQTGRLLCGRAGLGSPGSSLGGREVSAVTDLQHKIVLETAPVEHQRSVREHRAAATTAGILYIIGTVAGVLSTVVSAPARDAGDPLAYAAEHSSAVVTGALLVLVMGLSLAFVPVVLFSVLRRVDEVLAVGYLVVRGAVETVCYVLIAIGWLLLVPLGGAMAAGLGTASPAGVRVGSMVIDADATNAVLALVFCLGAGMFYVLLYRSRIVPRWISVWGLMAIPLYVAGDLLAMYGVFAANGSGQVLMFMPMAVQEMVLAVWMIARGFRPAVVATTSELVTGTPAGA